ncbi:MAG: GNAT family N-acetyltransferase [Gammaproteobacteria bacterium]|nr:GNAT family N-acetyltransferase [Gammaproteobacteria bacterium]MBU2677823.1 GNAT family N-acetyltransferase [Gammaproteobacteria bacterium]NNC58323.1 GNAT family N-acetyltransferase [Woeseiaceae bacterium]NNL51556.1 GNAT family N-acetyltransferase [Woeseiaceae bacterium]
MSGDISIRDDLRCGDLGRIISLHGEAYESLDGFGLRFEAYVARTIAEYVLDNDARGRIWLAEQGSRLIGCTAVALRDNDTAQIRWVVVDPSARGNGLGNELVGRAVDFCKAEALDSIYLFTTDGLPESQSLYEKLGFSITSDETEELWDGPRPLIRMQLDLA